MFSKVLYKFNKCDIMFAKNFNVGANVMEERITIFGTVIEIIYQNQDNGYTVCEIDSKTDGLFAATGYMPYLCEGENINMVGNWTIHPDYGEQFKVHYYETVLPTDENAILDYLSSGIIYGIRRKTATKIVEKFGLESLEIILTDPLRLAEIKGISKEKAEKIGKSYLEIQSMQSIMMFLQQYGISTQMSVKVHQVLGGNAVNIIKENPYILSDKVDGIAFKTADTIASLMGLPKNSPLRIKSGIIYILNRISYSQGHSYYPKNALIDEVASALIVSREEAENGVTSLELEHQIYTAEIDGEQVCYLAFYFTAEIYVAQRIASLSQTNPMYTLKDKEIEKLIGIIESEKGIYFADEQKNAVRESVNNSCIVITGGPGTGKTTTINAIIRTLSEMQLSIALCAPTGRAAKRMSQVTGLEAKTIHRLLGFKSGENTDLQRFSYDENSPLPYDVIIVDEVSMVDIQLMFYFLKAVKKGAKLIFSGDADQLPSVAPGNVLKDIIASGIIPVIKLNNIFRQAEKSLIVTNAHKINNGEMPEIADKTRDFFFLKRYSSDDALLAIMDLYKTRLPNSYDINPVSAIQVLSPSKKGVVGSINLNHQLQQLVNPPNIAKAEHTYGKTVFRVGDKVMQIKNNYDIVWNRPGGEVGEGIFNGDQGIIKEISVTEKTMTIIFDDDKETEYPFSDLDSLDLAYAITVHKSQGCEFPFVIIPVCNFAPMLMCRNLLYTAVTRAKTMVILVGQESSCKKMIDNNSEQKRFTGLESRMKNIAKLLSEE